MVDTYECEHCHELGYLEDYSLHLEVAVGNGELLEAKLGCPHCGESFDASEDFARVGYHVMLIPPSKMAAG